MRPLTKSQSFIVSMIDVCTLDPSIPERFVSDVSGPPTNYRRSFQIVPGSSILHRHTPMPDVPKPLFGSEGLSAPPCEFVSAASQ